MGKISKDEKKTIGRKLREFKAAMEAAGPLGFGLLYYAGHGGAD